MFFVVLNIFFITVAELFVQVSIHYQVSTNMLFCSRLTIANMTVRKQSDDTVEGGGEIIVGSKLINTA